MRAELSRLAIVSLEAKEALLDIVRTYAVTTHHSRCCSVIVYLDPCFRSLNHFRHNAFGDQDFFRALRITKARLSTLNIIDVDLATWLESILGTKRHTKDRAFAIRAFAIDISGWSELFAKFRCCALDRILSRALDQSSTSALVGTRIAIRK